MLKILQGFEDMYWFGSEFISINFDVLSSDCIIIFYFDWLEEMSIEIQILLCPYSFSYKFVYVIKVA